MKKCLALWRSSWSLWDFSFANSFCFFPFSHIKYKADLYNVFSHLSIWDKLCFSLHFPWKTQGRVSRGALVYTKTMDRLIECLCAIEGVEETLLVLSWWAHLLLNFFVDRLYVAQKLSLVCPKAFSRLALEILKEGGK